MHDSWRSNIVHLDPLYRIIILSNMQDHRTSLNIYKVSKIFVRNKTQSNHNNPCPLVPEVMQTTTLTKSCNEIKKTAFLWPVIGQLMQIQHSYLLIMSSIDQWSKSQDTRSLWCQALMDLLKKQETDQTLKNKKK